MPLVPALIGLFAISEALVMIEEKMIVDQAGRERALSARWADTVDGLRLSVQKWWHIVWTSFVGLFIGITPGAGASIAAFVAYQQSRLWSKHPELYGTGIPEGVIAPEAANNGVTSGTLVPTLALGVPGGSTAAVMMIVLQYHGMVMGPRLFATNPEVAYGVFVSMAVAYIFMIFTILPLARYMSRVVLIETTYLAPIIVLVTIVAAFGERQYLFDMGLALVFGVIGYIAHKTNYHVTAILIGILLGPLFEQYLVRALRISQGDLTILFSSTIGNVLWAFSGPLARAAVVAEATSSVDLSPSGLDDLRVLRVLRADQRGELLGRREVRLESAEVADAAAEVLVGQQCDWFPGAAWTRTGCRQACRPEKTEPGRDLEVRIELTQPRQLGIGGRALLSGYGERAQLAGLDMAGDGIAAEHHRDLAGQQRHRRRAAAFEGDVQQIDAGARLEHLHHQVVLAAVADRGVGERRLGAPRILDELLQVLHGQRRVDREHHLRVHQRGDRLEVLQRIERHLRVEMRPDDDLRVGAKEERVPVRRCACGRVAGNVAVRAGAIVDDDRLAERFAELRREYACEGVSRTARRIGD